MDWFNSLAGPNLKPAIKQDAFHLWERRAHQNETIGKLVSDRLQFRSQIPLKRRVNFLVAEFRTRGCNPVAYLLNLPARLLGSVIPAMTDQHRNPRKSSRFLRTFKIDSSDRSALAELHAGIAPASHIVCQHRQAEAGNRFGHGFQI